MNSGTNLPPPETDDELMIIHKKYAAPQLGKLSENELRIAAKVLVLKIHVITGWVVPDNEMRGILTDQFSKKLLEDYSMLNSEEVEFAFRKSGTVIKDWGKQMNLNLLDQVLLPYLGERVLASASEEKRKNPPAQRIYSDEEILNERRRELELAYQAMRDGKFPLIHVYFSEVLCADGFIEKSEDINDFFVYCLNNQVERLYQREK